jgi:hypothetical protein
MSGIAEIVINGEKVGLKYGLPAMQIIYKKLGDIKDVSPESLGLISFIQMVWGGHVNYCLVKEIPKKYTYEEIFEWVEDNIGNPELLKALEAFRESKFIKNKPVPEEEKKSPLAGKKLKKRHTEILV